MKKTGRIDISFNAIAIPQQGIQDSDGHPVTGNAANHITNIAGNTFINPTSGKRLHREQQHIHFGIK